MSNLTYNGKQSLFELDTVSNRKCTIKKVNIGVKIYIDTDYAGVELYRFSWIALCNVTPRCDPE